MIPFIKGEFEINEIGFFKAMKKNTLLGFQFIRPDIPTVQNYERQKFGNLLLIRSILNGQISPFIRTIIIIKPIKSELRFTVKYFITYNIFSLVLSGIMLSCFLYGVYDLIKNPAIKSIIITSIAILGYFIQNLNFKNLSGDDIYFLDFLKRETLNE